MDSLTLVLTIIGGIVSIGTIIIWIIQYRKKIKERISWKQGLIVNRVKQR